MANYKSPLTLSKAMRKRANRYFAVSDNASEYYPNRESLMRDLPNFGDDEVHVYSLKETSDIDQLGDDDLLFTWLKGVVNKK